MPARSLSGVFPNQARLTGHEKRRLARGGWHSAAWLACRSLAALHQNCKKHRASVCASQFLYKPFKGAWQQVRAACANPFLMRRILCTLCPKKVEVL